MLGAAIAAREGKLLTLATGEFLPKGRIGAVAHVIAGAVGEHDRDDPRAWAAIALVQSDRLAGDIVAGGDADNGSPTSCCRSASALIAMRLAWRASPHWAGRAIAALGIVAGLLLNQLSRAARRAVAHRRGSMLILSPACSARRSSRCSAASRCSRRSRAATPPVVLPMMAYQELTTSTGIAAIPLFTLAGFLLAEGKSSERLLRVFRAWVGWTPGGTAIAAATLCAFFTLFTGGSGVTILVLGGLLLPALVGSGYRERFSIGLLTASGSLGLLFPLSLPLMLYGIVVAEGLDRGSVHRRAAAGPADARAARARWASAKGWSPRPQRTPFRSGEALALVVGREVGAAAAGLRHRRLRRRHRDAGRIRADRGALHLIVQRYINRDLPTWKDVLPRRGRLRRARRRRAADSRRRRGADRLFRLRADSDAARRVDAGAHALASRVPARASTSSCCWSAR